MRKPHKSKWIWLAALLLFVCVMLTTTVVSNRLNLFQKEMENAIELVPQEDAESGGAAEDGSGTTSSENTSGGTAFEPVGSMIQTNPGFMVSDGNTRWTTTTQVQIFSLSYEDGRTNVTVRSDNGDKLIAPGTEQSYTFRLYNTGDTPLDYSVEVDAYFTPADVQVPITARLSRYDGEWLSGDAENFAQIPSLDAAIDSALMGAGNYVAYTLEWVWPFEGDDALDTMLGNRAAGEEITFTIGIKTMALESTSTAQGIGIKPPQTGDDARLAVYVSLGFGALAVAILMFVLMIQEKREAKKQN